MKMFESSYHKNIFKKIWFALNIKIMLNYLNFRFKLCGEENHYTTSSFSFLA